MTDTPRGVHLVESLEDVDAFVSWLRKPRRLLGLDTETTGLNLVTDRLRLIQFGDEDEGWSIPTEEWRGLARWALETYTGPVVLQNAKFDAGMLEAAGIPFPWSQVHDTRVMLHLHDSLGPQALKPAAAKHLGPWARSGESELKKAMAKNRWNWATVPTSLPAYWAYGALDTIITVRLAHKLWPEVQYARGAYDLEMACQRVLTEMELRGVQLDMEYVERTTAALREKVAAAAEALPVNPNSPQQLVSALQSNGVHLTKRTANNAFSVAEEVLEGIEDPLAAQVLSYRKDAKLLGSYFETFLEHQTDGRLHPSFNQLQARTGRMSVTNPAMQTLPRDAFVRDAIVPDSPEHVLILADYDTQELRVAAHLSRDENMISAFLEGRDLHAETARMAFGPNWTKEQRTPAKNGMYSWAYGAQQDRFGSTIGVDRETGDRIYDGLGLAYPGMKRAMAQLIEVVRERAKESGRENGWVKLLDGRHLSVPSSAAYKGFNYAIQGFCSVVLKQAVVNLDMVGLSHALRLLVHDEIVFSLPRTDVDDAVPVIKECMERNDLVVPLTVGIKVVDRWGDPYR